MRITRMIAVALAAGVLLAGCSSDGGDATGTSGAMPARDAENKAEGAGNAAEPAAPQAAPDQAQGTDTAAKAPNLSVDQRSIIYTGSITVRVKNVSEAAAKAIAAATAAGGFVGGDTRNRDDGGDNASLTLRVPADKFAATVDQLAGLGEQESRAINTEDVTEQTIDLDARIAVQQARLDSGRRLLAQAKSLSDLVMLEREVATREADLASLQAKKRRLADLTALSTITVVLLDPAAEVKPDDDAAPGFLAGLKGGWTALTASLGVLVTVLGAVLPWLIALGVPAAAVLVAIRRRRRAVTEAQ